MNVLDEAVKIISFIKSDQWLYIFLVFYVTKWEIYIKHIAASENMIVSRKGNLWRFEFQGELTALQPVMGHHFYLKEWLTNYCYLELGIWQTFCAWSFPIFKNFSSEIGDECDSLISCNEMRQHLEELHNWANQYFPNDWCVILQIQLWVKDPLQV